MTKIVNGDSYRKMLSREIKLQKIQNLRNIANQVKKKEDKKDRKKAEFQGAETKVVWSIAKTSIQIHQTYPPNETRFDKTKGKVWNLIQWQEFWIHLTKFDATTRKLNGQYDIQLAISKTRFFPWYVAMKYDTEDGNAISVVDLASIPLRTLFLLCYMTVSRMTLTWHFCGGWMLQKVDMTLLVLLEIFQVWSLLGLFQILIILVLDYRCP